MTQAPAIKKLREIEIDTAAIKRSNTKFNLQVSELLGLKTNIVDWVSSLRVDSII